MVSCTMVSCTMVSCTMVSRSAGQLVSWSAGQLVSQSAGQPVSRTMVSRSVGQPYYGQPYHGQPYNGQPYHGQLYYGQDSSTHTIQMTIACSNNWMYIPLSLICSDSFISSSTLGLAWEGEGQQLINTHANTCRYLPKIPQNPKFSCCQYGHAHLAKPGCLCTK